VEGVSTGPDCACAAFGAINWADPNSAAAQQAHLIQASLMLAGSCPPQILRLYLFLVRRRRRNENANKTIESPSFGSVQSVTFESRFAEFW
jgi:hypothetical protein